MNDDALMTLQEVATMLKVPIQTMYGWRYRGEGPRGMRVGRHVRYRRRDVERWLDSLSDRRVG